MPVVSPEKLIALQRNADEVRNVRSKVCPTTVDDTKHPIDMYSRSRSR